MSRNGSTFSKRQKEQARQQRQRDKALRRNERKQTKSVTPIDDTEELRKYAEEQAALFRGENDASPAEFSSPRDLES
jgi:hypothetical protein